MPSAEFEALSAAISDLKAGLLDFPPSPVEPYSKGELLKCQAFVVFSHAEMQSYWESVSRRILRETEERWTSSKHVDRVVAALIAFRSRDGVRVPHDPVKPNTSGDIEAIIKDAIQSQKTAIDENNGIKRANIGELMIPLGLFKTDFFEALLIQSDQTGIQRGDIVHKSTRVSLRKVRDPFADEMKDIDNLLSEILVFDTLLSDAGLLSVPSIEAPASHASQDPA